MALVRNDGQNTDLRGALNRVGATVGSTRTLQSQILILSAFEVSPRILARQREAFPGCVTPEWPSPEGDPQLSPYAEACCNEWLWGKNQIIDPSRPYFIAAFRSANAVAMEIGRQMESHNRPPAGVVQIGDQKPISTLHRLMSRARTWVSHVMCSDEALTAEERALAQAAARDANRDAVRWARRHLASPSATTPVSFPVFQLLADADCRGSKWLDNQRCRVRAESQQIELTRAPEVNAFLMRIIMSGVRGIQLDAEQSANRTLDRIAELMSRDARNSL